MSRKSLQEMFEVPALTGGGRTNCASGWFVEPNGPIWHGGTLEGYGTVNMLVPASGHAVTILGNTAPVFEYEPHTWGPAEADRVIADGAGWHNPKPEPC